ncbi:type II secretion system F family protein [Lujinxingia litoralis]|uniref:type II secretion system F family protein n=1 Tax=Lujinxingia litoralis TaxID=2211119 RepID=UPI001314064C|nr:type II secretion system F family protein [Lujinxingia litoralis]
MLYLWLALALGFGAGFLAIWAGGDWIAERLSAERGVYERIIGKELHRLFLPISPQEFVLYHAGFFLVCVLGGVVLVKSAILGAIFGAAMGLFLPRVFLKRAWANRLTAIDEQVEEAMVYMANSFKANPSLPEAIQDVCNAMGPPISQEFGVLLKEYRLGTPLDQALVNMQRRVPSRNLELAISALVIGRTVGGNIPEILSQISGTIRESFRLERVIDTQTAQGKMQAWVMGLMPAVVIAVFYKMDPTLIQPLFETFVGYIILAAAGVCNIIGVVMILKIVQIDV